MGKTIKERFGLELSEEQRTAFKDKYGEDGVRFVTTVNGATIVVRKATRAEYKLFRSNLTAKDGRRESATENLFRQTVLIPDASQIGDLLEEQPGTPEEVADVMLALVGIADGGRGEKL